jgi:hypothetical protein
MRNRHAACWTLKQGCRVGLVVGAFLAASEASVALGLKVLKHEWDAQAPASNVVNTLIDSSTALSDAANRSWGAARAEMCAGVVRALSAPGAINGQTLRDVSCAAGGNGELNGTQTGEIKAQFVYRVPGNRVEFTYDFPSPAGSRRVALTFDAVVNADAALHASDPVIRVVKSAATVDRVAASDPLANVLINVILPFVAPQVRLDMANEFNAALAGISAAVRQASGGIRGWIRQDKLVMALLPAVGSAPLAGNGTISGVIRFPASVQVAQQNPCAGFSVRGSVQSGPPPIENPDGPNLGVPPTQTVGAVSIPGGLRKSGDSYECDYTLGNLPAGVPVVLGASSAIPDLVAFVPSGWNGIAVAPATGRDFRGSTTLTGLLPPGTIPAVTAPAATPMPQTQPPPASSPSAGPPAATAAAMPTEAAPPPAPPTSGSTTASPSERGARSLDTTRRMVRFARPQETDTNRFGSDYRSFPAGDANACQTACAGEGQCRAWTWVKPGVQGPQAKCWLKNAVPVASKNVCCVSGLKTGGN